MCYFNLFVEGKKKEKLVAATKKARPSVRPVMREFIGYRIYMSIRIAEQFRMYIFSCVFTKNFTYD